MGPTHQFPEQDRTHGTGLARALIVMSAFWLGVVCGWLMHGVCR